MNISNNPPLSPSWPTPHPEASSEIKPEYASPAKIEHQRDPNAEFYRYEESPWLPKTPTGEIQEFYKKLPDKELQDKEKRYFEKLHEKSGEILRSICDTFYGLKDQLSYVNPELSKKYFGFTLGFDQQIKVTDPDGVLTPAEVAYLTEQFNNRTKLQNDVRAHARLVMTMNDHDRKNFPDRRQLNLENFSKIIDYGQLFCRNTIGNYVQTLSYQLERNAEKVEEEPKRLVDVQA
ncbi:hypothetical protein EGJ27_13460 [Pseudomonas sp. v388]|uniref:hypothetical protein n=1 Tax=Pseudomonas sp. v388 TaxID=2479849 RepID=UPI000F766D2D|nr:hypothetical protein [Pseudomonas sp. v388]RRV06760.1 hypothetical protein EGJ27_13460 [Pseudomonas sp. v388]